MLWKRQKLRAKRDRELITAIDIGTSKTCCIIGEMESDGSLTIVGTGQQESQGLRSGQVIDMQDVELSVLNAVHLAEQMADDTISNAYISISGCKSQLIGVELTLPHTKVENTDIKKLMISAQQIEDPSHRKMIHSIPTYYSVDDAGHIRDPRGLHGSKLGVNVHMIHAALNHVQNLQTCIHRCHLQPLSFVATPLAAGLATLDKDEMSLGCVVIDMGAGLTSLGIFTDNNIIYTDYIPVGGSHITNDIARILSTPLSEAERLKNLYGSLINTNNEEREVVKVAQIGTRTTKESQQVPRSDLTKIIRPRLEETFELINARLESSGVQASVCNRVVLTGGASQLVGIQDIAQNILGRSVRIGKPSLQDEMPEPLQEQEFATCVGVMQFAKLEYLEGIQRTSYGPQWKQKLKALWR